MNARIPRSFATIALAVAVSSTLPAQSRYDLVEKSIGELQEALQAKTVTSVQLVEAYLARIDAYDRGGPQLNSIIAVNPKARDEAAALDRERQMKGSRGPLH